MSDAFTPAVIQWLQDHAHETRVPAIHISCALCLTAATLSVLLRYLARRSVRATLGRDDYCLFLAYILYVAYIGVLWSKINYGEGRHVNFMTKPKTYSILSLVQASLYIFGMLFAKYSILFLYHRIFPSPKFRMYLIIIAGVVFAWAMAAFWPSIFSCFPVAKTWDPSISGRCIDYGLVTLVIGIANIVLDFVILGAPMPLLWGLRMSVRRKFLLTIAFTVGCVACVVSIARLFYAREASMTSTGGTEVNGREVQFNDPGWSHVWPGILSGLEVCTAIVACCTITYRPLFEKFFRTKGTTGNSSTSDDKGWREIRSAQEMMGTRPKRTSNPTNWTEWEEGPVEMKPLRT